MKLSIKYNKKVDVECWERLIQAKKMFGCNFPKRVTLLDERILLAKNKVTFFKYVWKEFPNFENRIKKIYKNMPPKYLKCYINTSGFSMEKYPEYISISAACKDKKRVITMLVHEISHFMFRKYFTKFCYSISCNNKEIEDIKEILTVINNDVFKEVEDSGYKVHSFYRKRVLRYWKDGHDVRRIIKLIKKLFNKKII